MMANQENQENVVLLLPPSDENDDSEEMPWWTNLAHEASGGMVPIEQQQQQSGMTTTIETFTRQCGRLFFQKKMNREIYFQCCCVAWMIQQLDKDDSTAATDLWDAARSVLQVANDKENNDTESCMAAWMLPTVHLGDWRDLTAKSKASMEEQSIHRWMQLWKRFYRACQERESASSRPLKRQRTMYQYLSAVSSSDGLLMKGAYKLPAAILLSSIILLLQIEKKSSFSWQDVHDQVHYLPEIFRTFTANDINAALAVLGMQCLVERRRIPGLSPCLVLEQYVSQMGESTLSYLKEEFHLDYYPLRAAICEQLLEPVFYNSSSSSYDDDKEEDSTCLTKVQEQSTIRACCNFLNRENPFKYLQMIKAPITGGEDDQKQKSISDIVPERYLCPGYPLLTHLEAWLSQDDIRRAIELVRAMEKNSQLDEFWKDQAYFYLWQHLLRQGNIFLDGNTDTPNYFHKRELLYNGLANGMGAHGRGSMMEFYQQLARTVWDHPQAMPEEKHYVLVACQQTLLRLLFKCRGLGANTVRIFLKDTTWPVPLPESSSLDLDAWPVEFLLYRNPIPESLLASSTSTSGSKNENDNDIGCHFQQAARILDLSRLVEKEPLTPVVMLVEPNHAVDDENLVPAAAAAAKLRVEKENDVLRPEPTPPFPVLPPPPQEEYRVATEAEDNHKDVVVDTPKEKRPREETYDDEYEDAYEDDGQALNDDDEYPVAPQADGNNKKAVVDSPRAKFPSAEAAREETYDDEEEEDAYGDEDDEQVLEDDESELSAEQDVESYKAPPYKAPPPNQDEINSVDDDDNDDDDDDDMIEIMDSKPAAVGAFKDDDDSTKEMDDNDEDDYYEYDNEDRTTENQFVGRPKQDEEEEQGEYSSSSGDDDDDDDPKPYGRVSQDTAIERVHSNEQQQDNSAENDERSSLELDEEEVDDDDDESSSDSGDSGGGAGGDNEAVVIQDSEDDDDVVLEEGAQRNLVDNPRNLDSDMDGRYSDDSDHLQHADSASDADQDEESSHGEPHRIARSQEQLEDDTSDDSEEDAIREAPQYVVQVHDGDRQHPVVDDIDADEEEDDEDDEAQGVVEIIDDSDEEKGCLELLVVNAPRELEEPSDQITTSKHADAQLEDKVSPEIQHQEAASAMASWFEVNDRPQSPKEAPLEMYQVEESLPSPPEIEERELEADESKADEHESEPEDVKLPAFESSVNEARGNVDSDATDDEEERALEVDKAETEDAAVGEEFGGDTTEEENGGLSSRANMLADADRRADVLRARTRYASQLEEGYEPEDTHGYTEEEVSEAIHTEDEEEEHRVSEEAQQVEVRVAPTKEIKPFQERPSGEYSDDMDAADEHEEDPGAESSELEEGEGARDYCYSPTSEHSKDPARATTLLEFAQSAQRLHQYGRQTSAAKATEAHGQPGEERGDGRSADRALIDVAKDTPIRAGSEDGVNESDNFASADDDNRADSTMATESLEMTEDTADHHDSDAAPTNIEVMPRICDLSEVHEEDIEKAATGMAVDTNVSSQNSYASPAVDQDNFMETEGLARRHGMDVDEPLDRAEDIPMAEGDAMIQDASMEAADPMESDLMEVVAVENDDPVETLVGEDLLEVGSSDVEMDNQPEPSGMQVEPIDVENDGEEVGSLAEIDSPLKEEVAKVGMPQNDDSPEYLDEVILSPTNKAGVIALCGHDDERIEPEESPADTVDAGSSEAIRLEPEEKASTNTKILGANEEGNEGVPLDTIAEASAAEADEYDEESNEVVPLEPSKGANATRNSGFSFYISATVQSHKGVEASHFQNPSEDMGEAGGDEADSVPISATVSSHRNATKNEEGDNPLNSSIKVGHTPARRSKRPRTAADSPTVSENDEKLAVSPKSKGSMASTRSKSQQNQENDVNTPSRTTRRATKATAEIKDDNDEDDNKTASSAASHKAQKSAGGDESAVNAISSTRRSTRARKAKQNYDDSDEESKPAKRSGRPTTLKVAKSEDDKDDEESTTSSRPTTSRPAARGRVKKAAAGGDDDDKSVQSTNSRPIRTTRGRAKQAEEGEKSVASSASRPALGLAKKANDDEGNDKSASRHTGGGDSDDSNEEPKPAKRSGRPTALKVAKSEADKDDEESTTSSRPTTSRPAARGRVRKAAAGGDDDDKSVQSTNSRPIRTTRGRAKQVEEDEKSVASSTSRPALGLAKKTNDDEADDASLASMASRPTRGRGRKAEEDDVESVASNVSHPTLSSRAKRSISTDDVDSVVSTLSTRRRSTRSMKVPAATKETDDDESAQPAKPTTQGAKKAGLPPRPTTRARARTKK